MESRRRRRVSSPLPAEVAAAAAAMSLVLGDDDLLAEILLRLAFPTTLVRAALACKRWLRVASSPGFLRRFRAGFLRRFLRLAFPAALDVAFLPSPKPAAFKLGLGVRYCSSKLLPENSSVGRQCWELLQIQRHGQRQTTVQINKFKRGAWRLHSSVPTELHEKTLTVDLSGGKFYITSSKNIFVLDSLSSTCSVINFPENFHGGWLSKASDSGVYLISVTESLHLRIWLHRTVSSSFNNWLLVDTICLRAVFADLGFGMPVAPIGLCCVGENAEFVLLKMGGSVFYFNIHCRTLEKLFDKAPGDTVRPFFPLPMIWPPSFPRVEGHDDLEE
ncbi:hypothetical protein PR202_ga07267 [Eleusine coracana subsp. coracana]|uniref:F-box domain-containing protein n=1 Tax=Eleusine coracana subsp. coracana TaxID=191504 RepID=A0AAV5BYS7_ELECO|nr:hypothetical protein PR202_ga07267 [Eleusine coracana subsp. coracana]